jgi:hypothetical protein
MSPVHKKLSLITLLLTVNSVATIAIKSAPLKKIAKLLKLNNVPSIADVLTDIK